jgi:hypothetical protein
MPIESHDDDSREIGPGLLPTPFSPAEVRAGCPAGRTIRLRVESAGTPDVIRVSRYLNVDAEGAEIEDTVSTLEGEQIGEARVHRATWRDLQAHATFPTATTTVADDELTVPVGTLPCRLYTMTDGSAVHQFWFSAAHPGMPVRYSTEESGTLVSRVTMESDTFSPG